MSLVGNSIPLKLFLIISGVPPSLLPKNIAIV